MDFLRSALLIVMISLISVSNCKIIESGYLATSQTVDLSFNNTNPDDCLEYKFMTNYKKVLFELITTPSTDASFKQRIILSDMQYTSCPQRCSEEPNYCVAISSRLAAKTEAMFSKCFPTLYVYIINQAPTALNMLASSEEEVDRSDASLDISTTSLADEENTPESSSIPIFSLTPAHMTHGCKVVDSIVPQCASLSLSDCINPAFCTTECTLLTCKSLEGNDLFSLCTATNLTHESLYDICTAHAEFHQNYTLSACENPIEYNPSLQDTTASILLLCLVFMGMMISCVCCYNLRLTKTNEMPCDVCPFCPECLFPREIRDNPLYQEDNEDLDE